MVMIVPFMTSFRFVVIVGSLDYKVLGQIAPKV
jgi:hypothetical protein